MLICYMLAGERTAPENIVHIEKTAYGWKVEKAGKVLDFDVRKLEFQPDMANLFEGYHELFIDWSSGNSCDKAGFFSSMFRNRGYNFEHIGSIYVDAAGESHLFTRFPVECAAGTEPTIIEHDVAKGTRSEDAFLRCLPESSGFAAWNQRHRTKINMLGHISANDSLAALEAQVDLLTKIVLGIAPESDEKAALAEATAGVTVDTIHDLAKLQQTIARQKAHIRAEQKKYFEARGDAQNADLSA